MSNPKPDFSIVIKTSISSITKHLKNICPNSKRNTNQGRVTFPSDFSKSQLLSFLQSIYISRFNSSILIFLNFLVCMQRRDSLYFFLKTFQLSNICMPKLEKLNTVDSLITYYYYESTLIRNERNHIRSLKKRAPFGKCMYIVSKNVKNQPKCMYIRKKI